MTLTIWETLVSTKATQYANDCADLEEEPVGPVAVGRHRCSRSSGQEGRSEEGGACPARLYKMRAAAWRKRASRRRIAMSSLTSVPPAP